MKQIPSYELLMNPLLQALKQLGGSGSIEEIYEKVTEIIGFPESILNVPHDVEKSNVTEVGYRLAWARTYLKKYGILENSSRGVWAIVPDKRRIEKINHKEVVRVVREMDKAGKAVSAVTDGADDKVASQENLSWKEQLHHILTQEMDANAFERLVKRLLGSGSMSVAALSF